MQNGRMDILPCEDTCEETLLAEREITLRGIFELSNFLHTFLVFRFLIKIFWGAG
jgi:hypothetical protein